MTNDHINVRNVYIELLNKLKMVEGVDIQYIDHLVDLLNQDIYLVETDVQWIESLIPSGASSEDQLVKHSDLPSFTQVNSDWNATSGVAEILNKPTIPAAQVNSDWNAVSGVAQILNKPSVTESFTSVINIASNSWILDSGEYIYDYTMPSGYTDNSKFYISLYGFEGVDPSGWGVEDYNKIYWCQSWTVSGVTKVRFYAKTQPGSQLNLLITAFK